MSALQPAGLSAPGGIRQYLTLVFSDLSGSTELGAEMEAEFYADLMTRLRGLYQQVVAAHGGTVVRMQGDGMLAMFGHPQSQEDDGRRATRATLELHRRVGEIAGSETLPGGVTLSLHSGIHAGLVLVDEGDVVRGRYELLGNAPNVAARLSTLAGRDQVLVTEETLGRWRDGFDTGERRLIELRGKQEALAVYEVYGVAAGETGLAARARRRVTHFVGRLRELDRLDAALREALAKREFRHVAIVAPAGAGKTRLAEELLLRAATLGWRLLRGYCESELSAEPLQPLLQMLRATLGLGSERSAAASLEALDAALAAHGTALDVHRPALLDLLSLAPEGARPTSAGRRLAALQAWFEQISVDAPLLVFVDDWQWADAATREVLAALRRLPRRAIVLLVTTRGFDAGDADLQMASVLALSPLDDQAALETIQRLLPGGDPFVAREIRRYAGGNPLFIEELCHSVAHGGGDRRPGRGLGGAAWLAMLIASRVSRLPAREAELVRAAAVIGTVIPAWLLERLTGCRRDDPMLQSLADADLIFPGELPGTLRFKHGVTRDVIYDAVGLHRRRALHLRAAQALEQPRVDGGEEPLEALAYHYGAAGETARGAQYAEGAGDKAVQAAALDRAQSLYRAAMDAIEQSETGRDGYRRWMAIAQRFALTAVFDPSDASIALLRRAVERAQAHHDDAALAGTAYWLGYLTFAVGDSRGAIEHCERALAAARRIGDEPLAVQIRATLGQALGAAAQYGRALGLLDEAITIKRQHRSSGRPAVGSAFSLATHGAVLADLGRFDEAHASFDEALEVVQGTGHWVEGSIRCWRAGALLWQGRWTEAREAADAARRDGERVRSLYIFAMGRSLAAYADWMLDPGPLPLQSLTESTGWLVARGKRLYLSLNHGWLAEALTDVGHRSDARWHAAAALRRARALDRLGEAMTGRALARLAAVDGDSAAVTRHLQRAWRAAQERRSPHEAAVTDWTAALLAERAGRRVEAQERLGQALEAFQRLRMDWHRDRALALGRRL